MAAFLSAVGGFLGRHWIWVLVGLLAASLAMQGHTLTRVTADRAAWRHAAVQWRANADGWKAGFRESERRRGLERGRAEGAVREAGKACDARVATARASARAIERIVTRETPLDPRGCPVRSSLGRRELRDALAPDAR